MAAIDWNSLDSPADWQGALATLQQAAATAKAGTRADREAVETELAHFWTVPCPFATKIDRARKTYNELTLIDLGQLASQAPKAAKAPAVTGLDLLHLAEAHLGEKYVNVQVPKDNPNWHGPWDCAEFVSWVVYQKLHVLYGCDNDHGNPALADAYSGYWVRDAQNGTLPPATQATADTTAGIVLIRKPPMPGTMGHVALSDGRGGTVEAAGTGLGVRRGKVEGRLWHYVVQIPGVAYAATGAVVPPKPLPYLLTLQEPNIKSALVGRVQRALKAAGFDPGVLDNQYGPHTVAAVAAFQRVNRLVSDGVVGPLTAKKLGVDWPG